MEAISMSHLFVRHLTPVFSRRILTTTVQVGPSGIHSNAWAGGLCGKSAGDRISTDCKQSPKLCSINHVRMTEEKIAYRSRSYNYT